MLSIEKCRKLLGEEEKLYNDEQILELVSILDVWADITIETYYDENRSTNKKEGGSNEPREFG